MLQILVSKNIKAKTVVVNFLVPSGVTSDLGRFFNTLSKDFEAENKNVKIKYFPGGSYDEVLNLVLTNTNEGRGVAIVEISELLTMKDKKSIIPLDQFFKEDEKKQYLSKFIPGFLENSYDDLGGLYGLPVMRSTPMIYYNLDHLKKANIDTKKLPETWDELTKVLQKLKSTSKNPPLLLAADWYDWIFEGFIGQAGGRLANKNNTRLLLSQQPTVKALTYWQSLIKKGLMVKNVGTWKSTIKRFIAQKTSVVFYSSGAMNDLEAVKNLNWATSIMPKDVRYSVPVGASNVFITSGLSEQQKAYAFKFLKFLGRTDIQAKIAEKSGYFPVTTDAFKHPILLDRYSKKHFKIAREQLNYSHAKSMTRHYRIMRTILKKAIDKSLDAKVDPQKSLSIAQQEADRLLNKVNTKK